MTWQHDIVSSIYSMQHESFVSIISRHRSRRCIFAIFCRLIISRPIPSHPITAQILPMVQYAFCPLPSSQSLVNLPSLPLHSLEVTQLLKQPRKPNRPPNNRQHRPQQPPRRTRRPSLQTRIALARLTRVGTRLRTTTRLPRRLHQHRGRRPAYAPVW